jgi:exonuclease VII small subunit
MTKFNYSKAVIRLKEISAELEGEVADISHVSELVKESKELLTACKKHLKLTSKEIEDTLDKIDEPLA